MLGLPETSARPHRDTHHMDDQSKANAFIKRWSGVTAGELSTSQSFILDLCDLLGVDKPHPTADQSYMFERPVEFHHGDGTTSPGRVDCYRRAHFVLESKKLKAAGKAFDDGLLRARTQAENYARALPADEGRPPFVIVVDVGTVIELYAEFTRSGATYTPYPDPRSHRIRLTDLADEAARARLRTIWTDPLSLDPSRVSAKVTREVAERLAEVARVLEGIGHAPKKVAGFLTRCLFSMFAEDVGLLPKRAFVELLESLKEHPAQFAPLVGDLWRTMDGGGFCVSIRGDLLRFNGKLFKNPEALPLDASQIDLLLNAAKANWRDVEPAIFGTLLERALDPDERHALGAHYTPRAYVERLVLPTIVEPLREDWKSAQAAALVLAQEGRRPEAQAEVRGFLHKLANIRVLDPACGSGNFLYVTLEHLKRLEGEVLNQLDELGDTQGRLDLAGVSVDPHQLLGIELNPRAAEIAEMVLWIGYLQWHFRTRGLVMPPQPVLKDFRNIECRDAVLDCDRVEFVTDERGVPVTRWDGRTYKKHPVTGEDVPDESARVPIERYVAPRKAIWPEADFVIGNPPFIGNKRMRTVLGDGYVVALREQWSDVPDTADFVMYWWDKAAELTRSGHVRQFGLITTNSIRQTFNRKVVDRHLFAKPALSLPFVVSDHPWVDSADGAAVRIAMTVGSSNALLGRLYSVVDERPKSEGEVEVTFDSQCGQIHSDLTIGANVTAAKALRANGRLCFQGFVLVGEGFVIADDQVQEIQREAPKELIAIRSWKNGRDLSQNSRGHSVIDLYPHTEESARQQFPFLYQHLLNRVKPFRDQVARRNHRERWWLWGEARPGLRAATHGLARMIVTNFAAKHRYFVFESPSTAIDHNMYVVASPDALLLGVLSSQVHVLWMLRAGSTLEDRPLWISSTCFLPFPFPDDDTGLTPTIGDRIRSLAEQIDAFRKERQRAHSQLTLNGMYNVLKKLRSGEELEAKERDIHQAGLISVLGKLHDDLDEAVLDAYGWSDLVLPKDVDELLGRLVKLNMRRAAEEARGKVRWLRLELQLGSEIKGPAQIELPTESETVSSATNAAKKPWPIGLPDQIRAVANVVSRASRPIDIEEVAAHFSARGRWRERLPTILATLGALGRARELPDGRWTGI